MASGSVVQKSPGSHTYTYSSQPRSVPQRQKYRETEDDNKQVLYGNIMYDRRIIRGNTYAVNQLPATSKPDPVEFKRQQEAQRRQLAKKRARERMRETSPKPVEGRKHIDVQTELYLEEITDRVEEADVQTQTDAFLNRPATPLFIPAKTGADVATQIEEGDLFDFDIEVKPILEVLVGKTVEQALMEVMEEEELASLRAQQREFEENRNAELVETQRLEEQERRHREEKERRMHQQREALLKEKETAEKIAARAFAQSYLNDLVPSVFSILYDSGYFYDTTEREIETTFMPWLMEQVGIALEKKIVARMVVDALIKDIVMKRLGIQPQPTSSENIPGTTTEAPSEVVSEAGKDDTEGVAVKADATEDSKGTEQDEVTSEKPTETDQKKVFGEQGDKPESEAEPKTETEPSTEGEPKTDTKPKADDDSKTDVDSKAETEPKTDVDSKAETEPKTDVDSKAETEPKTDVDSKAETEPKTDVDSKAETEPKTDVDSKAETEPKTDVDSKAETEPKTDDIDPKTETEPKTDADAKPETEPTAEVDSKTETEPKTDADAKPETEPTAEADSKTETEPKTDVDPKPEDSKLEEPAPEPVTSEETKSTEEQKETEPTQPPTLTEEPGTDEQTTPIEGDTTEQPKDQPQEDTN